MPASRLRSEIFSNVDAAWLHMEQPSNMAMITGVLMFDRPLDFQRLRATIEHRFLTFDRFCQRVREPRLPLGLPRWETDPNFNLDEHLLRVRLPDPGDQIALQDLVGDLMSTQLDFSKPLWQMHYVENFGQGSAIINRLHHCIGDGLALVQVLLSMTDEQTDAPWPEAVEEPTHTALSLFSRLLLPALKAARFAGRTWNTTGSLLHEGMQLLVNPAHLVDAAKLTAGGTRALGKLLLIPPDRKTIFKGKCGIPKHAAWSTPIPLEEVKTVAHLMGGTVNDILLSAVTGGLRRYLENRGEPTEGLNIRAVVPVSLRPQEDLDKLGNRFGLVFLSLPVGIRDPLQRLFALKRRMDSIKNSPEAMVAFGILGAIGMTPAQIEHIIVSIFGMKGTAVMTNVPGPRQQLYMAGGQLTGLMFWVPQPGNLAMGVSIISYNGEVILGVATDACLVPNPELIVASFQAEFAYLKRWGQPSRADARGSRTY